MIIWRIQIMKNKNKIQFLKGEDKFINNNAIDYKGEVNDHGDDGVYHHLPQDKDIHQNTRKNVKKYIIWMQFLYSTVLKEHVPIKKYLTPSSSSLSKMEQSNPAVAGAVNDDRVEQINSNHNNKNSNPLPFFHKIKVMMTMMVTPKLSHCLLFTNKKCLISIVR